MDYTTRFNNNYSLHGGIHLPLYYICRSDRHVRLSRETEA